MPVRDIDRSLPFWTATLGLVVTADLTCDQGIRRVELAIPGTDTGVGLVAAPGSTTLGSVCRASFECEDLQGIYRELTSRGVEFIEPPKCEEWGTHAKFVDPDGNTFALTCRRR